MDRFFYELIRISIGVCSDLSSIPSNQEWLSLRSMAMKQAIDGIAFEGFIKYKDNASDVQKYQDLKLQWMASVLQLEQRNELTNLRAQQLTNFFKNGGFRTCVLKGQGVAYMYPKD